MIERTWKGKRKLYGDQTRFKREKKSLLVSCSHSSLSIYVGLHVPTGAQRSKVIL